VLTKLAKDPVGFAGSYGAATGRCCFCNKPLKTEESTAVGYGPVCADRFGLPWGKGAAAPLLEVTSVQPIA
jgi:hypothetical protein